MGEVTRIADAMPDWRKIIQDAETDPAAFREQFPRSPITEPPPLDRIASLTAALVPERFHGESFATYAPKTPSQSSALRAAQKWVGYAEKRQPAMLALIGEQGTGKSHLLYAALLYLINRGLDGAALFARPWYRLADELRYGDAPGASREDQMASAVALRLRLWEKRIAFLDEVRPTASTAFDDTELAKYACHAYDKNLAVLITTNVSPLADVMGPAAASRFTQIIIEGPDHRQERASPKDRQLPTGDR